MLNNHCCFGNLSEDLKEFLVSPEMLTVSISIICGQELNFI